MKKKQNKTLQIIAGYIIFFLTVALTVTVALIVYEKLLSSIGEKKGAVSLAMLAVILFVALVCTLIDVIRRKIMVSRPVGRILAATERIARGDFSVRLEIKHTYGSYDEYDLIMENLNMLALELGKNEVLNTEFISNVSHELKTPIAVIKNSAELLASQKENEEERRSLMQISSAAQRLSLLVGNILKLNKLENNKLLPEACEFKIDELLSECLVNYTDKIDEKGIGLECDIEECRVSSSPSHIEIIFNNLISNAVKFTERGGEIRVALEKNGDDILFSVSDTGCGISREDGAKIFDKFYQADTSHSTEGTGLGLSLTRRVVELLGGEISVESTLGEGSTFSVRLRSCAL